jgi:hypothetical protein
MAQVNIPLLDGLKFGERNAEDERLMDCSYTSRLGVLASRARHKNRFALVEPPRKVLFHPELDKVFTLTTNGNLAVDAFTPYDTGYSSDDGTLLNSLANEEERQSYLFIAGGNKMRKFDGHHITQWGIDAPQPSALVTTLNTIVGSVIHTCDNLTNWTFGGCTVTVEPTIKVEGTGSLKVALVADTVAEVALTAPIDMLAYDLLTFMVRLSVLSALKQFTISVDFAGDNFSTNIGHRDVSADYLPQYPPPTSEVRSTTLPQSQTGVTDELVDPFGVLSSQMSSTPHVWKRVALGRRGFQTNGTPTWNSIKAIKFNFLASKNMFIYIDYIRAQNLNQDDAVGARYKYAYENVFTGTHGNLNANPSIAVAGLNGSVTLSGFVQPPANQGINVVRVFRDTGGDGTYRSVVTFNVTDPWNPAVTYVDTVNVSNLGDADTNDNAPAPLATQAVKFMGRIWLNDVNNKRRVWRSVPGRYESFSLNVNSGFFDVSSIDDEVVGFAVIREQLFILTKQKIIQVIGDDSAPSFLPIVEIGTPSSSSYYVTRDFMVFVHQTGVYTFDAASLKPLPKISTLFNPQSDDPEAIVADSLSACVVGSDAKHIWVYYADAQLVDHQLCYSLETQRWTEESTALLAHDAARLEFAHIAASASHMLEIYNNNTSERLDFKSQVVELVPISQIEGMQIEYKSTTALRVRLYLDGGPVIDTTLPLSDERRWAFLSTPDLPLGNRVQLEINALSVGLTELYTAFAECTPLPDTTHFNSGYFTLTSELATVVELYTNIFATEDGEVTFALDVDNQRHTLITRHVSRNQILAQRNMLRPLVGRTARLQITGARHSVMSLYLKAVGLGDGEIKNVAIPTNR